MPHMLPFSVFLDIYAFQLLYSEEADKSYFLSPYFVCLFICSVFLNDGCLGETGVFPSASSAYCGRAHKAVQAASRETALPELSVGLEAHRLVCLTLPLPLALSAVRHYLFFVPSRVCTGGHNGVFFVGALGCTAPRSLVSRHWNRQASLYRRG